jgi:uncharacterized protein with PIN domain
MSDIQVCERCGKDENEISILETQNPYQADMFDNHEECLLCTDCYNDLLGEI